MRFIQVFDFQRLAMHMPEIRCQIPHQAVIIAIPPRPSKYVKIKTSPKPEFWIPVSIVMVFTSSRGSLNTFPVKNPAPNATKLCANTQRKIREMYFVNRSKFPANAITTKAAKISMLRGFRILEAFSAIAGAYLCVRIPRINGMPSINATVLNASV